jgi:hypothetical protein
MTFATTATCAFGTKLDPFRPLEISESLASIILLRQFVLLDHGAHCAIQYQDAAG